MKRGGALHWPPYLPTMKILGFKWSKKAKITLETIGFWQNIFINILKFSPFLHTMKACQFFKIWKPFDNEREKNTHAAVNENRKTEKRWTLFYNSYFIKLFNMLMNHFFYFASSFAAAAQGLFFDVGMTQKMSKGRAGNDK